MMTLYLAVLSSIYLTNGHREDYDIHDMLQEKATHDEIRRHHGYPPYYFSHKYFPSFSAWMMEKDEIYQNEFMDDSSDMSEDEDEEDGKYSDKTQLTAFLLAFFLGSVAAGRWYVGAYVTAVFKLIFGIITCGPVCFQCISTGQCRIGFGLRSGEPNPPAYIMCWQCCACFTSILWFVWWLTDVIYFGINGIPDYNTGLPLTSWQ